MLTTAGVTQELRDQVAAGSRPMSEYLVLERDHGVTLMDWTALRPRPTQRSLLSSLVHVGAAWASRTRVSAILSDGEHLGLPLAAALSVTRRPPRHIAIGHHLSTLPKRRLTSLARVQRGLDVVIVHSQLQAEILASEIGLPPEQVRLVRYGVDTNFWSPQRVTPERLIVSAGREHRDYATLSAAVKGMGVDLYIADGSTHSPRSSSQRPDAWPVNVSRGALPPTGLREMYGRAAIVVVPLLETDFQAGITVIVEAMAMGRPVVVSATAGLRGALGDSAAVRMVQPGNPRALRDAIRSTLALTQDQTEIVGRRARAAAVRHHSVIDYAAALNSLLEEVRGNHGR